MRRLAFLLLSSDLLLLFSLAASSLALVACSQQSGGHTGPISGTVTDSASDSGSSQSSGSQSSGSQSGGETASDSADTADTADSADSADTGSDEGGGVGDPCSEDEPCREGLVCNDDDICEPAGTTPAGGDCVISAECADGLVCIEGMCAPAGDGSDGDACVTDADCQEGYRCGLVGFSLQCIPEGDGDLGGECETAADCFGGLTCTDGMCAEPLPGFPPYGGILWEGVECDPPSEDGVRAYFELPGASPAGEELDFFRLPFPNDARLSGGGVDLDGYPTPGSTFLGYDPVEVYVDALEADATAWGMSPTVIFRFSGGLQLSSFQQSDDPTPLHTFKIVDVTLGDPDFGDTSGYRFYLSGSGNKYVCHNWIGMRRSASSPLVPGHTYAFYMTTRGKAADGSGIERSGHLQAMLAGSTPGDSTLADAHVRYEPLRDYLTSEGIDPDTILNASVVTVAPVRDTMEDLAATASSLAVGSSSGWVKCSDSNTPSPCPQAEGDRACGSGTADYDEYHALVEIPIYQNGTLPFMVSGGDVSTGSPTDTAQVCMAMTVPTSAMPAAGWPTVIYAHGTNGSFRSHVRDEVAGELSNAAIPGGGTARLAVIGIDQLMHGTRRGGSTKEAQDLFFNPANPDSARGNPLQGAADQIALARFAASLDLPATTTGGDDIRVDPANIVAWGHSQGALHVSMAAPYYGGFSAVVLSGHGGSTMHSVLEKRNPVDIAGGLPFALQDFNSQGALPNDEWHAVLTLLQQWMDPADPYTFARTIAYEPANGQAPMDVFVPYGQGDTYTPPRTIEQYVRAAKFGQVDADASVSTTDDISITPVSAPLVDNVSAGGEDVTAGTRQYANSGDDGHFVAFDVATAQADVIRFLVQAVSGQEPQIGN